MANRLSPTAVITATKDAGNPTLNTQALPENITKVGSTYYLVYQTGNTTDTGVPWNIHLATSSSPAGPWTEYASNPIFTKAGVAAWASATDDRLYAPEIRKFGDTFYLYFSVVDWDSGTNGRIGVATASTITGPYTDSGAAILSPAAAGLWDSLRVGEPSVLYDGTQYVMAYMGEDTDIAYTESEQIGIATASSPTGPWTKAPNNPLLPIGAAGAWDDEVNADPFIFMDSGYYWIWYTGGGTAPSGSPWSSGLAYATNPLGPWTKHTSNPILPNGSGGAFDDEAAFRGSIYRADDGTYHVPYTAHAGSYVFRGGNATLNVTTSTDDVGVWLDFGRDGFGTNSTATTGGLTRLMPQGGGSAIDDNITADVTSYTIRRGAQSEVTGGSVSDSCTIVVQNSDGKYSPDNTASAYATRLRPGCPVWIGMNGDGSSSGAGTVYGRFAGVVREITPIPVAGATNTPTAEIICDGILADYALTPVRLEDSTARSQQSFRRELLLALGETVLRMDLDDEPDTLPLSSADNTSAVSVLDDLNRASGTRHFVRPSESLHHWYDYVTRNRNYKFGAAADDSIDAGTEHLTGAAWRYNNDSIINSQRASLDPIRFSPAQNEVWSYEQVPFGLTGTRIIWANFDDYVASPALSINTSSGSVTSTLTPFGRSAKIELWSAGATITELSIEGSQVSRDSAITVDAEDLTSQGAYRVRAGSDLAGELLGSQASAQGIVDHIVYRYGSRPLKRPTIDVTNWLPDMFALDPYDLLGVTIDAVSASGVKFEIVGIDEVGLRAASASLHLHSITFQLAEARIQGTQDWFTWDESVWDGPDLIAY